MVPVKPKNNGNIQKLNAWSFELLNDDFCVLNIERPAALHVHDITCTDTSCKFRKKAAQKTDGRPQAPIVRAEY